jgi:hypothetical protein
LRLYISKKEICTTVGAITPVVTNHFFFHTSMQFFITEKLFLPTYLFVVCSRQRGALSQSMSLLRDHARTPSHLSSVAKASPSTLLGGNVGINIEHSGFMWNSECEVIWGVELCI